MKHYYWCNKETGLNPHIKQVFTEELSPRCHSCEAVMTYGKYSDKYGDEFTHLLPGVHATLFGRNHVLEQGIIAH